MMLVLSTVAAAPAAADDDDDDSHDNVGYRPNVQKTSLQLSRKSLF